MFQQNVLQKKTELQLQLTNQTALFKSVELSDLLSVLLLSNADFPLSPPT